MTREEWARLLDGREYRKEMSTAEVKQAQTDRMLVVFGASDDLMEFRGILNDEDGVYDNVSRIVSPSTNGRWYLNRESSQSGVPIKAEWCPPDFKGSWRISTPISHSTFSIMEDGELYCVGIVIAESDMFAALYGS